MQANLDGEGLVVVGTGFGDGLVGRLDGVALLQQFLEVALGVAVDLMPTGHLRGFVLEELAHEGPRPLQPLIDGDRADQCLERPGQNPVTRAVGDALTVAEHEITAQVHGPRPAHQRLRTHEGDAVAGQGALIGVRKATIQLFADDGAEHGVAEKLQPLVGLERAPEMNGAQPGRGPVVQDGAVGERQAKRLNIMERQSGMGGERRGGLLGRVERHPLRHGDVAAGTGDGGTPSPANCCRSVRVVVADEAGRRPAPAGGWSTAGGRDRAAASAPASPG